MLQSMWNYCAGYEPTRATFLICICELHEQTLKYLAGPQLSCCTSFEATPHSGLHFLAMFHFKG
jgi:hypothetical protein